jgi:hypothetical protein
MEKNEISKAIKKKLVQKGLGFIKVRGGKGTAWGWIDVFSDRELTDLEKQKFYELFGIELHRNSAWVARLCEWESALGYSESKDLVSSDNYQKLKDLFYKTALTFEDSGTCCGGAGTIILKDGKKIDFWKNYVGQSDHRIWMAEKELKPEFSKLGLTTIHESGWMD